MKSTSRFKNYTLRGWVRYLILRVTGRVVRVRGQCSLCGRCCRRISLEANGRWIRKEREFNLLVTKHPDYDRFEIVDKDSWGFLLFTCSWYTEDGVCRDHEKRLSVCREFPHVSLYFSGGDMPSGCGYSFVVSKPFSKYLTEEMNGQK